MADVPVYFVQRLNDPKAAQRLDLMLRARGTAGVGFFFAASEEMPSHLGPNIVMPLLSHLASADEEMLFARDGIDLSYRDGLSLAREAYRRGWFGHASSPARCLFLAGSRFTS